MTFRFVTFWNRKYLNFYSLLQTSNEADHNFLTLTYSCKQFLFIYLFIYLFIIYYFLRNVLY